MARFHCELDVRLRRGVLDPAGLAVSQSLRQLGHRVSDVRIGKRIEIEVDAESQELAAAAVEEMARTLLANPVLEDFSLTVRPG